MKLTIRLPLSRRRAIKRAELAIRNHDKDQAEWWSKSSKITKCIENTLWELDANRHLIPEIKYEKIKELGILSDVKWAYWDESSCSKMSMWVKYNKLAQAVNSDPRYEITIDFRFIKAHLKNPFKIQKLK